MLSRLTTDGGSSEASSETMDKGSTCGTTHVRAIKTDEPLELEVTD